jgi:hypothetical protein
MSELSQELISPRPCAQSANTSSFVEEVLDSVFNPIYTAFDWLERASQLGQSSGHLTSRITDVLNDDEYVNQTHAAKFLGISRSSFSSNWAKKLPRYKNSLDKRDVWYRKRDLEPLKEAGLAAHKKICQVNHPADFDKNK